MNLSSVLFTTMFFCFKFQNMNFVNISQDFFEDSINNTFNTWTKFSQYHYNTFQKTYSNHCVVPVSTKCFKHMLLWSIRLSQKNYTCLSDANMLFLDNFPRWTLQFKIPGATPRKERHVFIDNVSFLYLIFTTLTIKNLNESCVKTLPYKILASQLFKIELSDTRVQHLFEDVKTITQNPDIFSRVGIEQIFSFTNFMYFVIYSQTKCDKQISTYFKHSVGVRNVSTPFGVASFYLKKGIMSPIQNIEQNNIFLFEKPSIVQLTTPNLFKTQHDFIPNTSNYQTTYTLYSIDKNKHFSTLTKENFHTSSFISPKNNELHPITGLSSSYTTATSNFSTRLNTVSRVTEFSSSGSRVNTTRKQLSENITVTNTRKKRQILITSHN
ncbi:U47 protein [macacine betaherpesvirus 9]|uniref:U47 protein n=1 Tax=macacine betaherpesvirus 9 TaxID=2560568 RepID=A0A191S3U3_9BETA|nr:U47 protein [macacine betaherpesvirus 9]ANC96554.1 U47 protein [macacine betaherpesvirus 9]